MTPTDEQQAIISHNYGPALVFAVAGSGKTTTVAQRIDLLVRETIFEPEKILATSFNRDAVKQIQRKIAPSHAAKVSVMSLHQLGYRIIRTAERNGDFLPSNYVESETLVAETIREARKRTDLKTHLEQFEGEDFESWVSVCKGNLQYANLAEIALSQQALRTASQATAPAMLPWYLELYRLLEQVRVSKRWITYDDMLMTGWEALVRLPDLLKTIRSQYNCVIVDEFQDINLAQSEMLHEISSEHRNYMAVGDDDQTIYEWRGASPRFILEFAKRYDAKTYAITDNFRCPGSQVALANAVIKQNNEREKKELSLTQGFRGTVISHGCADATIASSRLIEEIKHLIDADVPFSEMVILVRTYDQTTSIESELLVGKIPYVVVGNPPFYRRPEIVCLIHYLKVASIESKLLAGQHLTSADISKLRESWNSIYNNPARYVSKVAADHIRRTVVARPGTPLTRSIIEAAEHHEFQRLAKQLLSLSTIVESMAQRMDDSAYDVLKNLDHVLQYRQKIKQRYSIEEIGQSRAGSVSAFFEYSRQRGTVREFLDHLEELSFGNIDEGQEDPEITNKLRITTIYRAKGSEWDHVFVPGCNDGTIPIAGTGNVEEERRLLYVAITRAKRNLHLFWVKPHPSEFLRMAEYESLLQDVALFEAATANKSDYELKADIVHGIASRLSLRRFLERWWKGDPMISLDILKGIDNTAKAVQPAARDSVTTGGGIDTTGSAGTTETNRIHNVSVSLEGPRTIINRRSNIVPETNKAHKQSVQFNGHDVHPLSSVESSGVQTQASGSNVLEQPISVVATGGSIDAEPKFDKYKISMPGDALRAILERKRAEAAQTMVSQKATSQTLSNAKDRSAAQLASISPIEDRRQKCKCGNELHYQTEINLATKRPIKHVAIANCVMVGPGSDPLVQRIIGCQSCQTLHELDRTEKGAISLSR